MDLIYNIKDKPKFGQTVLFALQQLLAAHQMPIAPPQEPLIALPPQREAHMILPAVPVKLC